MKQIAAVCAAAALYIFTVFASARVQAQPAVQVDAPETPPAHTESVSYTHLPVVPREGNGGFGAPIGAVVGVFVLGEALRRLCLLYTSRCV